jgi:NAD(P)-dependent dehydrogenase (short-subunit alcohol dehydrogenase family)
MQGIGAVVTGASRGLGKAVARELAERGARLVLVARDPRRLEAVARELPGDPTAVAADLGDPADVARVAAIAHDRLGPVDWLVNNAGTLGAVPLPLALDLDPADLAHAWRVNVEGPFRLTRALAGPMVLRGSGLVVSVSSDAAVDAYPTWGAYGSTKAAFDHLMRTFAAELVDTGVRFVVVDPGEMDTDMHAEAMPSADRATLADPARVAARLIDLLPTAASGARVRVEV